MGARCNRTFDIAVNDFDAKEIAWVPLATKFINIAVDDLHAKQSARCRRVLVVTELFNIAVNEFDAKESDVVAGYSH